MTYYSLKLQKRSYTTGDFFAGASCSDIYIYIYPSSDYQVSATLVVNDCQAQFGLIPISTDAEVSYMSYLNDVNKIKRTNLIKNLAISVPVISIVNALATLGAVKLVQPQKNT